MPLLVPKFGKSHVIQNVTKARRPNVSKRDVIEHDNNNYVISLKPRAWDIDGKL